MCVCPALYVRTCRRINGIYILTVLTTHEVTKCNQSNPPTRTDSFAFVLLGPVPNVLYQHVADFLQWWVHKCKSRTLTLPNSSQTAAHTHTHTHTHTSSILTTSQSGAQKRRGRMPQRLTRRLLRRRPKWTDRGLGHIIRHRSESSVLQNYFFQWRYLKVGRIERAGHVLDVSLCGIIQQ